MPTRRRKNTWNWSRSVAIVTTVLVAAVFMLSCGRPSNDVSADQSVEGVTLRLALYPYVPNNEAFEEAVRDAWPLTTVGLEFVDWDCYSSDPPSKLDVFVFDGIFLSHFADAGFLRPFAVDEIDEIDDYLPYAISGSQYDDQYFALPQIGCTNVLYFREGDKEMAAVESLTDLWNVLGPATYTWPKPPPYQGLMMDFSGGTTDACIYVAADELYYDAYTTDPSLPSASNLDANVMTNLGLMVQMDGPAQAAYADQTPYQRGSWFDEGTARAMVGFTESMSAMSQIQASVQFKPMPLADGATFDLFFVDVVGVNSEVIGTEKEKLAVQLANLLAGQQVISQAFEGPAGPSAGAQYLMPVRTSVFETLGQEFPQYLAMYNMVENGNPLFYRLGPTSRNWLAANKDGIRQQILGLGAALTDQPIELDPEETGKGKP